MRGDVSLWRFRYSCEKVEATQLLSTYIYIHIYIYACICVHKRIYLIERCFVQTYIKKSQQTWSEGKKKEKYFKNRPWGKKVRPPLAVKIFQSSSKSYADWLAGLDKEFITGFRNGKETFLSSEIILSHLKYLSACAKTKIGLSIDKKCT